MDRTRRAVTLMIAALGGQGGGVVADWLIDVARRERHLVQATSVPGVAQRTGATFYYLEFFPEAALPGDGRRPVMALMPESLDPSPVVTSGSASCRMSLPVPAPLSVTDSFLGTTPT